MRAKGATRRRLPISSALYVEGARNLMGGTATLQQKLRSAAGGQALKGAQLRERSTARSLRASRGERSDWETLRTPIRDGHGEQSW
jgi:hypothetical protein